MLLGDASSARTAHLQAFMVFNTLIWLPAVRYSLAQICALGFLHRTAIQCRIVDISKECKSMTDHKPATAANSDPATTTLAKPAAESDSSSAEPTTIPVVQSATAPPAPASATTEESNPKPTVAPPATTSPEAID